MSGALHFHFGRALGWLWKSLGTAGTASEFGCAELYGGADGAELYTAC